MKYNLIINDKEFDVEIGAVQDGYAQVYVNDEPFEVDIVNFQDVSYSEPAQRRAKPVMARRVQPAVAREPQPVRRAAPPAPARAAAAAPSKAAPAAKPAAAPAPKPVAASNGAGAIKAPMPGLILDIKVQVGDAVKAGQVVAVMEAMKMENDLPSPLNGTVKEICVQKGAQVSTGDPLIIIG